MEKDQELEHPSRLLVIFSRALGEGGRGLLTLIAKFELFGVEKLNQRKAQKGEFCPCCFLDTVTVEGCPMLQQRGSFHPQEESPLCV